jgi:hypothetical protein
MQRADLPGAVLPVYEREIMFHVKQFPPLTKTYDPRSKAVFEKKVTFGRANKKSNIICINNIIYNICSNSRVFCQFSDLYSNLNLEEMIPGRKMDSGMAAFGLRWQPFIMKVPVASGHIVCSTRRLVAGGTKNRPYPVNIITNGVNTAQFAPSLVKNILGVNHLLSWTS